MNRSEEPVVRRELLLAAISDTEGTIRATDTKASIALILHGFVFSGVLGALEHLGSDFDKASGCFRTLIISLTSLAAIAFLASLVQLLRCVVPAPERVIPKAPVRGVFYVEGRADAWTGTISNLPTFSALRQRIDVMDDGDIDAELTGELLKISAIRARKIALARSGLWLLGAEVAIAVAMLVCLGIDQLH